jgi:hypothetical protein
VGRLPPVGVLCSLQQAATLGGGGTGTGPGQVAVGDVLIVQVTASGALQLGDQGDTVVLVDPGGAWIDQVTYH